MSSLSVVIPVYNSQENLADLYQRLIPVLKKITQRYEVIFVDDGSRDNSWGVIEKLMEQDTSLRAIQLVRNFGQHNALLCGIREAKHEVIATLDDDLQNPPEQIPILLEKLQEGYDVVYGYPEKGQHGFLRNLASQMVKIVLQNAMGAETARHISAFRIFRKDVREAFINYQGSFISIDVLLTWGTSKFVAIPVQHVQRTKGKSNYTLTKLIMHAMNMLVGFSTVPLQIASIMGFIFMFFGGFILVYVVGRYFIEGGSVPGFPFLACIIALFAGVQLFALGIIGEYLVRIHFRSMGRPSSVVRQVRP